MACYTPILVRVYKNEVLKDIKRQVPCGQCEDCLNSKRAAWTIRLETEEQQCRNAFFITLTYQDDQITIEDGQPILVKSDLQKFFKRYRKKTSDRSFKYYAVGEYGEEGHRPHYHAIVFNVDLELLLESWNKKGFVHAGTVTTKSINYVTSYVINKKKYGKRQKYPPFAIMSKGLGRDYANSETIRYHLDNFDSTIIQRGGVRYAMPRYLKSFIFSEQQIKAIGEQNRRRAEESNLSYEDEISKRQARRKRIANSKKGKPQNF